jgi:hypothetical protein
VEQENNFFSRAEQVVSDAEDDFNDGMNYTSDKVADGISYVKNVAVEGTENLEKEFGGLANNVKDTSRTWLEYFGFGGGRRRRRSAHRRKGRSRRGGTGEPQQGYDQLVAANFPSASNFKGDNIYDLLKMNGGRRTRRRKPHYHGRKSKCYKRHINP